MATFKLTLEYDGAGFSGWASQPGLRTVEGEVGAALARVLGRDAKLSVAGRTDAGVHAWGQVVSFAAEEEAPEPARLMAGTNALTSHDVSVVGAELLDGDFDARRDALSRTYCYRVLARPAPSPFERGRSLWWPHGIDDRGLRECARSLLGTRDFTAFTPTQTDHVRFEREVLRAEWQRAGDVLEFWIEADTFMRHMVRTLVGTMLEVAEGRSTPAEFARLLGGAPREDAGPTAEPHGLYLASVRYGPPD